MSESLTMRRIPQQARSQRRVNHILEVAEQLFAEQGYEHVTTNAIAARAEIPIGSLYQFFPSKEVILNALIEAHTAEIKALMRDTITDELPISEAIGRFMDKLANYDCTHEGFKMMLAAAGSADASMHNELVGYVEEILTRRYPALAPERCHQIAIVAFTIVKGVTQVSMPPDNLPQEQAQQEVKTALIAYLQVALQREGFVDEVS